MLTRWFSVAAISATISAAISLAACTGEEVACKAAAIAVIEVTVTIQLTGEPAEGATVELDDQPCEEEGGGLYTCTTAVPGTHDLFVMGGMEYGPQAQKVVVPELGCDEVVVPVAIALTPPMMR